MGYKLYREVKVWSPQALTKGEKLAALVLADDANDASRITYHGAYDPEIMRQAMVPDDRAMRRILSKLQKEKVVERAGGGHNGRVAKYRFLHLAPVEWSIPGDAEKEGENHPPTDGTHDPTGGTKAGSFHPPTDTGDDKNHPPTGGVGGSFLTRRRVKTTRPTPPYTSTSSSSPANPDASTATTAKKRMTNVDLITEATGATEEEAQQLLNDIRDSGKVRESLSGFVRRLIENEDMHERLRQLRAARAPRPRRTGTHKPCTDHGMTLPCRACSSDINIGDFKRATRLLREHGPDTRWDLAQNQTLAQHLGEPA